MDCIYIFMLFKPGFHIVVEDWGWLGRDRWVAYTFFGSLKDAVDRWCVSILACSCWRLLMIAWIVGDHGIKRGFISAMIFTLAIPNDHIGKPGFSRH